MNRTMHSKWMWWLAVSGLVVLAPRAHADADKPEDGCSMSFNDFSKLEKNDPRGFELALRKGLRKNTECGTLLYFAGKHFADHPAPELYEALEAALKRTKVRGVNHDLARALGATRDRRSFEVLLALIDDKALHPFTRAGAAEGLGLSGDERARPVLLEMVKGHDAAAYGALRGLKYIGHPEDGSTLQEALRSPELARDAAETLGELKDQGSLEMLLRQVRTPGPYNRKAVLESLGKLGGPRVQEVMTYIVCVDESGSIRSDARKWLETAGEAPSCAGGSRSWLARLMKLRTEPDNLGFDSTVRAEFVPDMLAGLKSKEAAVRFAAAHDLGALHQPPSAPPLKQTLAAEHEGWVQDELREDVTKCRAGDEGFRKRLKDFDPGTRRSATSELRQTRFEGRDDLLIQQMNDTDTKVTRIALGSVGEDHFQREFFLRKDLNAVILKRCQGAEDVNIRLYCESAQHAILREKQRGATE